MQPLHWSTPSDEALADIVVAAEAYVLVVAAVVTTAVGNVTAGDDAIVEDAFVLVVLVFAVDNDVDVAVVELIVAGATVLDVPAIVGGDAVNAAVV